METLDFKNKLPADHCMNWKSVHICKFIQIKKNPNKANDLGNNVCHIGLKKQRTKTQTCENALLYITNKVKVPLTKTEDCTKTRPLQIAQTTI